MSFSAHGHGMADPFSSPGPSSTSSQSMSPGVPSRAEQSQNGNSAPRTRTRTPDRSDGGSGGGGERGDWDGSTLSTGPREADRSASRRQRNASSFLLEPSVSPVPRRQIQRGSEPQRTRKREIVGDQELSVPKRHTSHLHHRHNQGKRASIGSSPLATSVTTASPTEDVRQDGRTPGGSSKANGSPIQRSGSGNAKDRTAAAVGLDTDPAQIVNLALNLGESRRNASGRSHTGGVLKARRTTSGGQLPVTAGQGRSRRTTNVSSPSFEGQQRSFEPAPVSSPISRDLMQIKVSDGTLARAEKAQRHFELFSDYLRLLPHLPPLRRSSSEQISTEGREYNPLQYIRNRKVRFREKCAIDSEADGWEDTERVRAWVDTIVGSHPETGYEPDDCVQLPPFNPQGTPNMEGERSTSAAVNTGQPSTSDNTKPRRPRIDWITSPADLLADAEWLEQDSNKLKIEDRDGNKIYDQSAGLNLVTLTGTPVSPEVSPPLEEESTMNDNDQRVYGQLPTFKPTHSRTNLSMDRGRRRHKITGSMHITPSRSHSRNRNKTGWRKALSRSSSSSSTYSSDDNDRHRGRKPLGGTSKEHGKDGTNNERLAAGDNQLGVPPGAAIGGTSEPSSRGSNSRTTSVNRGIPLPAINTDVIRRRLVSPDRKFGRSISSSRRNEIARADSRPLSVEGLDSAQLPSSTPNLASPISRSSSPRRTLLSSLPSSLRQNEIIKWKSDSGIQPGTSDPSLVSGDIPKHGKGYESPMSGRSMFTPDQTPASDLRRAESSPTNGHYKSRSQQDAKLRTIFKGGRLAEIVGNEVSKVGDYIWKKEHGGPSGHSRQSSSASSFQSDYLDAEDEASRDNLPSRDEEGEQVRRDGGKDVPKYCTPNLPTFTHSSRYDDHGKSYQRLESGAPGDKGALLPTIQEPTPDEDKNLLRPYVSDAETDISEQRGRLSLQQPSISQSQDGRDPSPGLQKSITRDRRPITGLAGLDVSQSSGKRPTLSETTRNWSMSSRSITRSGNSSYINNREIARVRAHLLSSGIKALEICRLANTIRDPPPAFLLRCRKDSDYQAPRVPRQEEIVTVARSLMSSFEAESSAVQCSMSTFSSSTVPDLSSKLEELEKLVESSISPRIRAVTIEADQINAELATTGTLTIKRLHEALDKGIRKRNRRLRWLSRTGFFVLEWILVGVMWWVWLIVMVLRVFRGLGRALVSGVKWILWL